MSALSAAPILELWRFEHKARGVRVLGAVYGKPGFEAGSTVETSTIRSSAVEPSPHVITASGSAYRLGRPSEDTLRLFSHDSFAIPEVLRPLHAKFHLPLQDEPSRLRRSHSNDGDTTTSEEEEEDDYFSGQPQAPLRLNLPGTSHARSSHSFTEGVTTSATVLRRGPGDPDVCAICLDPAVAGQGTALFDPGCGHVFHFACIKTAYTAAQPNAHLCPICRQRMDPPASFRSPGAPRRASADAGVGRDRVTSPGSRRAADAARVGRSSSSSTLLVRGSSSPSSPLSTMDRNATMPILHSVNPTLGGHRRTTLGRRNSSTLLREQLPVDPNQDDDDEPLPPRSAEDFGGGDDAEFCLSVSCEAEFESLPPTACDTSVVVTIKAPQDQQASEPNSPQPLPQRPNCPVDLIAVVDISGSMRNSGKLMMLKDTLSFMVSQLHASDRLCIVTFDTQAARRTPLINTNDEGKARLQEVINLLVAGGGTNISEGIRRAVRVLEGRREINATTAMMLLTDGQDSAGIDRLYASLMDSVRVQGCTIHTFGFGQDHDANLLSQIADESCGSFCFVEELDTIRPAFAGCLANLSSVVALRVAVNIRLNTNVELKKVHTNYPVSTTHDGCTLVKIADLYAGEQRDILLDLRVLPNTELFQHLLDVDVDYIEPWSRECLTDDAGSTELEVERSETASMISSNPVVDRQRNRISAADAIAHALEHGTRNEHSEAVALLERTVAKIKRSITAHDDLCKSLIEDLERCALRLRGNRQADSGGRAFALSMTQSLRFQRSTASGSAMFRTVTSSQMSQYSMSSLATQSVRACSTLAAMTAVPPPRVTVESHPEDEPPAAATAAIAAPRRTLHVHVVEQQATARSLLSPDCSAENESLDLNSTHRLSELLGSDSSDNEEEGGEGHVPAQQQSSQQCQQPRQTSSQGTAGAVTATKEARQPSAKPPLAAAAEPATGQSPLGGATATETEGEQDGGDDLNFDFEGGVGQAQAVEIEGIWQRFNSASYWSSKPNELDETDPFMSSLV